MTHEEMEQVLRRFDEKAAETQRHFDEKAAETRHHFDEKAVETQRHFDVVAENLRSQIQLVAEGVLAANERLDRHAEAMRTEFAEVRAMIKFSYSELDRRVTHLESNLASLAARVERLEARGSA